MQLKKIYEKIKEIENHISDEPTLYTDMRGKEYCECHTTYNDYMSRAMASDIFYFQIKLKLKTPELSDEIDTWMIKMSKLNYRLMRMIDDDAGDRPMIKWKSKKAEKFISEIKSVMNRAKKLNQELPDKLYQDFIDKCKIWMLRVGYMNTWAFYLEELKRIKQIYLESQIEEFDVNGNKISGLDEEGRVFMKRICEIREILTKLIVKIPVFSEDYKYIMGKLTLLDKIGRL